jgi:hypothetical protein
LSLARRSAGEEARRSSDLFDGPTQFDIVALDIPIGLLNA